MRAGAHNPKSSGADPDLVTRRRPRWVGRGTLNPLGGVRHLDAVRRDALAVVVMAERTYLYSYGSGPWGASPTRRTKAYILAQPQFAKVHPELMRRLFALADEVIDLGSDFGFGGGRRSSDQQMVTFTSRYTKVTYWTSIYWDGSPSWPHLAGYYIQKPGTAPSAPPGRSYHEDTTPDGFALAVDAVGDHVLAGKLAWKHGLKNFADVNDEPWHYQPVEIPNARRNYKGEFDNVTAPDDEEDFMAKWTMVPGGTRVYDSRNDVLGAFKAGEVRKVPVALGVEAQIAGAVWGQSGWWSYRPDTDFSGNITSFSNAPSGVKAWSNWGSIPVVCPGGHIYVKSLYGGHIYIDTYAFKA